MADDISKVVADCKLHGAHYIPGCVYCAQTLPNKSIESATTPVVDGHGMDALTWMRAQAKALGMENADASTPFYLARFLSTKFTAPVEVELPPIDRDEVFQRDYIPLGRSGWEIQTKGKGSTYRLCEPDGHRLAIPNEPYLHETLTRMARDVHADYATLARQLAEANERIESLTTANELLTASVESRGARYQRAESQLAEATRRLGEVEGLLREWLHADHAGWIDPLIDRTEAAITTEPTK